jgi:putative heme-binding domain-containing protein
LGTEYAGNAFICESLSSLVTRRLLEPAGSTFIARRSASEATREFLASTDNWFHPVNLATGPDGALYVVDFYREFVEHSEYVADKKLQAEMNWRNGAEHGRIWRIQRSGSASPSDKHQPRLSNASSAELVDLLTHPVAWWRTTAHRLLIERQDRTVVPQLRTTLAESPSPLARLHALYVLDGLDSAGEPSTSDRAPSTKDMHALDVKTLRRALQDSDSHIRRHAVRLAARKVDHGDARETFQNDLIQMDNDPDPSVRFQLALTMGQYDDPGASHALVTMLARDGAPSLQLAALCGIGRKPWPLIKELLRDPEGAHRNVTFLEQLSEQFALQADEKSLAECLGWLTADSARPQRVSGLAALAGISRGLFARGQSLRNLSLPAEILPKHVVSGLTECVSLAKTLAEDKSKSAEERARATVIAANSPSAEIEQLVRELVQPFQPQSVQSAAVWVAAQANSPGAWRDLFHRWPSHTTATRAVMAVQAVRSPAGTEALISALESDLVSAVELSASTREGLSQLKDKPLRRRVQPILDAVRPADRAEVLSRYANVANRRGNSASGAILFKQNCQTCHAIHGVGQKVGPDLTSVASRRTDLLITDILDPSHQVSPDYINYLAVTKEGRVLSGLIAAETTESVTLRREEGQQDTILRSDIEQLRASGKSIMPDGLEQRISPEQLTDLLEFLHNPDVHQLK